MGKFSSVIDGVKGLWAGGAKGAVETMAGWGNSIAKPVGDYMGSSAGRAVGMATLKGAGMGSIIGAGTAAITGDNVMTGAFFGALGGGVARGALRGNSNKIISKLASREGSSIASATDAFVKWGGRGTKMAGVAGGLFAGSRVGPSDDPNWKGSKGRFSRGLNGNRGQRF